jgi:hypothetical protein
MHFSWSAPSLVPTRMRRSAEKPLGRWITGYAVVLIVLVFALWDMVFKPRLQ